MRRRAETQVETRARIVRAAVDLHRALGPARTTLSAVAEKAEVERHTLYRYFPREADLLNACRAHFLSMAPPPDADRWRKLAPGPTRVATCLEELYGYYAVNRQMIGNVLRDSDVLPVGRGFREAAQRQARVLAEGWMPPNRRAIRAALVVATDFFVWRALAEGADLEPRAAAKLMSRMVVGAS